MATQKEIAQFFQLTLRLGLVDTAAVEGWADKVIAGLATVRFPFTDLAGSSHLPRSTVDDLLGQVDGLAEVHIPGRMVLALLGRRLRNGTLTPEAAITHAREIGLAAPLSDSEYYRADALDDYLSLAASGTYGTLDEVRRKIAEFLETYSRYDQQIPSPA
jgi:hypothetical protein